MVTIRSLAQSSKYLREFNFFTFADTLCFFPTLYQQICDEIIINARGFAGKKYKEREPGLICRKLCGLTPNCSSVSCHLDRLVKLRRKKTISDN